MCSCLPSGDTDNELLCKIISLHHNIAKMAWEMEYSTLEKIDVRRLCLVGTCQHCGGFLCIGLHITDGLCCDDALSEIYRHIYQCNNSVQWKLNYTAFREMFVGLFHEQDRPFIREWLAKPENRSVGQMYRRKGREMSNTKNSVTVYTIIHTSVDAERGSFPPPSAEGSYLSLSRAQDALDAMVAAEKDTRDFHCSEDAYCEEYDSDYWEAYEDGYAAANFSRFDIMESQLHCGPFPQGEVDHDVDWKSPADCESCDIEI